LSPDVPPLPAFGGGSLADVLPALLPGLGVPNGDREPHGAGALDVPQSSRVCVVLVDGLGANALAAHPDRAPFLTALLDHPASRQITSVFPTTTPIALTSLGAGLPPGEHGITGLFIRLPEDGRLVNTLAIPGEVDMRALQTRPTVFERAAQAGVAVTKVGPRSFDGQGLSEAGLRGGEYSAGESVGERVAAAAEAVRRDDRALTYVYFGDLDSTGHRRGAGSEAWRQELTHIDRVVEQIAAAMPEGSTLLVTSDHGMVDVPFDDRWDVAETPALADGVDVVAGDMRGVHVHARPGAADDVLAAWRATLGEDFWVLSREEAVRAGLFGPVVSEHILPRLGDVVAAARGGRAVVDSRVLPVAVLGLLGLHGSVTDDELLVPLLVHQPGEG
jgi:hypothetical protein